MKWYGVKPLPLTEPRDGACVAVHAFALAHPPLYAAPVQVPMSVTARHLVRVACAAPADAPAPELAPDHFPVRARKPDHAPRLLHGRQPVLDLDLAAPADGLFPVSIRGPLRAASRLAHPPRPQECGVGRMPALRRAGG